MSPTMFDGNRLTITSSNDFVNPEYALTVPSDTLFISLNTLPAPLPKWNTTPTVIFTYTPLLD